MKKTIRRLISLTLAAVIAVCGVSVNNVGILGASVSASAASTVSAPVPDLPAGTYTTSNKIRVKLTSATSSVRIYYNLNNAGYKLYTSSISITKNSTLTTYAKNSREKSSVKTYKYELVPGITFTTKPGYYDKAFTLKLYCNSKNATMYYTTDGSIPTTSSKKYTTSGIEIKDSYVVSVLAVKTDWTKCYNTGCYMIGDDYSIKYKPSINKKLSAGAATLTINGKNYTGKAKLSANINGDDLYTVSDFDGSKAIKLVFKKDFEYENYYLDKVDCANKDYNIAVFTENFKLSSSKTSSDKEYLTTMVSSQIDYFDRVNIIVGEYDEDGNLSIFLDTQIHNSKNMVFDIRLKFCVKDSNRANSINDSDKANSINESDNNTTDTSAEKIYTSTDGRFSVNVGEANIIYEGKEYTCNANFYKSLNMDIFSVYNIDGNKDTGLRIAMYQNCITPGQIETLTDYRQATRQAYSLRSTYEKDNGLDPSQCAQWVALDKLDGDVEMSTAIGRYEYWFHDINVTYENLDENGIMTVSFSITYGLFKDRYGQEATVEGFLAAPYNESLIEICSVCSGSGRCQVCMALSDKSHCISCGGTYKCKYCSGKGYKSLS